MHSLGIASRDDLVDELDRPALAHRRSAARRAATRGRTDRVRRFGERTCPSISTLVRIVSRYATRGLPTFASTLNSRRMPVDDDLEVQFTHPFDDRLTRLASVCTRNDGSSCASLPSAMPMDFCVLHRLRLHGDRDDRFRKFDSLERDDVVRMRTACRRSSRASRPMTAAMSPARTSSISLRSFECICTIRPTRSCLRLTGVVDRIAAAQHTGVHAQERQRADRGVSGDLERERRERRVVARFTNRGSHRLRAHLRPLSRRRAPAE